MPIEPKIGGRALLHWVGIVHGVYYALGGLLALLGMPLVEAIQGARPEGWLARVGGALVLVIGVTLLVAAARSRVTPEIVLLATGSALALSSIDLYYVSIGRISALFLADAILEWVLLLGWLVAWFAPGAVRARRLGRMRGGAPGLPR